MERCGEVWKGVNGRGQRECREGGCPVEGKSDDKGGEWEGEEVVVRHVFFDFAVMNKTF